MINHKKISFLGLGVMGFPMAGHLAQKTGHEICVYNRTVEKAKNWQRKYKQKIANAPADAANGADIIFICVGNDSDLRDVLCGEHGVIQSVKEGAIIVDHTTASANIAREMYDVFLQKNVSFLDAPVSGGQAGAENGALTVMCGGDETAFEIVSPICKVAYAREIRLMGKVGAGQTTKMVNQICIAGTLQGLAEALSFGQKAGLNMDDVVEVIGKGAAQSWQLDNRGKTMLRNEFDFGFALDWMIKDLGIAIDEAQKLDADIPITHEIIDFYKELSRQGHGRKDTSALIKRLSS